MSLRSGNPALKEDSFLGFEGYDGELMSLQGTINKSYILLGIVFGSAALFWVYAKDFLILGLGAGIIAFILAIVIVFKKTLAPMLAPGYALFEGAFLGAISAYFELAYPGIVVQAIALTFGIFLGLLLAYQSGFIKVTENFKLGVVAATFGIAFIYILNFILHLFGLNVMPFIHEGGLIGIGFSVFVVIIASLNLVLDFDFIESGVEHKAPKYMEWYASFGLLVTLAWLYVEILRLLAKLRSSD